MLFVKDGREENRWFKNRFQQISAHLMLDEDWLCFMEIHLFGEFMLSLEHDGIIIRSHFCASRWA